MTQKAGRRAGSVPLRRLRLLLALSGAARDSATASDACRRCAELMQLEPDLVPFALVYLLDGDRPRLAGSAGLDLRSREDGAALGRAADPANWPLAAAATADAPLRVRDLPKRLRVASDPRWLRAATDALVMPVGGQAGARPTAVLVAGAGPRQVEDPEHVAFLELLAAQIAGAIRGPLWAEESERLRGQMAKTVELEHLKSDFLRLASHELRGPLAVIRGYLDMVTGGTFGEMPAALDSVLPIVTGKIEEMHRLVEQMLETARLEENRITLNRSRFDLRELTRQCANSLEPVLREEHHLELRLAPDPVLVDGDRSRVANIVTNVIDNAIKYSPDGGAVQVECGSDQRARLARVIVVDSGIGIDAGDLPRLFSRFGRIVNSDNSHIAGTGLGLYLARELARRHGGDISLVSTRGVGTTVVVTLPLSSEGSVDEVQPNPQSAVSR